MLDRHRRARFRRGALVYRALTLPVRDNVRRMAAAVDPLAGRSGRASARCARRWTSRCATSPSAPASRRRCSSQVERGETSPTLQVAARIAAGLDLRLSQLLRLDEDGAVSDRARRRAPRAAAPTATATRSSRPPLPGQRAELSRHTLAPGARHRRPRRPADARARRARDRRRRAGARRPARRRRSATSSHDGRRVTFDADLPHHFENPGKEEAVLLAVVSAGLRRS